MSVAINLSQKGRENKPFINPLIIISLCALTCSILGLLLFVLYLNFENNKLTDMRDISKQYHEVIENIIKQVNVEVELKGLDEIVDNKKIVMNGEYNVFLPAADLRDGFIKSIKKNFYNVGLGIKEEYNEDKAPSLLLSANGVQIARVNVGIKKKIDINKTDYIKEAREVYRIVKDFLFSQLISETEFIESLPELCSNGQDTWLHKNMTVFLSLESSENIFLSDLRNLLSEKLSKFDVRVDSRKEEGLINYKIYIKDKNMLSINIQKSPYDFETSTTAPITTSLKTQYPLDKYLKDYFEPITVFATNYNNYADEQNFSESVITDSISDEGQENSEFTETNENDEQEQIPKIAIILDDGGYRNPKDDPALELISRITFSILPDTKYAKELAKMADEKGFEVMLHMPMQTRPSVKKGSFPCELLINMSESEIKEKTTNALEQISEAKGVNNHTGGVFTLKEEPLKYFMKVLKEKKIFFVDSVVVGGSKAYKVAIEEGVPALQRDIFLDHVYTTCKIKENLQNLKMIAKNKGKAIGIGHFRDLTIKVLEEELPKFEEQGFELVHVSELFE